MANVTITDLPAAGPITGTESVPIVQNGQTLRTTTGAIAASPSQPYTYLTVTQTPQLANSRYFGATNGLTLSDGGAQNVFNITTTGALLSLVNSGTGFQVKTSSTAITGRSIVVSGVGLSITDGNGIAGDPTITLAGQVLNLANASINGFVVLTSAGAITSTTLTGTASQISITNPNGVGNPVFSIANDPVMPGNGSMTIPVGTTGQQPVASAIGMIRYDTTQGGFFGYSGSGWNQFSLSGGVTQVNTGTGLTGGPITGVGTISIDVTAVTAGSYGSSTQVGTFTVNAQGQLTAAANVAISASSIGAITAINGTANEITATGVSTVTLSLPAALTFTSKTVTGGTFNMTAATVGSDTVATLTATQTLTNKTISGSSNTLSNIGNASLTNSSITINGNSVSLGGSTTVTASTTNALTIGTGLSGTSFNGSTAVTIAIDSTVATLTGSQTLTNKTISGSTNTLTNIANASLTNSSVTVGTTAISLGASSLTLGGLTTVTVTQDPTAALDLATKQYVDAVAQGLDPKASCVAATTANITLSGTQTIDGVALIAGDRCLVKNQTLSQNNGIYLVAAGAWTRAADMDSWLEVPGAFTFIEQGTLYADTGWVCTSNAGGTLGTTPITWVQFAGVGSYTAGTGLTLTGTQFSLTSPVTVALGGTNATNATDARTNLVAAKSGTNSDITELYALNGTSGGVAYQNTSNQLIMGSALTFDGTMLYVPGGISGGTF
jgi:hypothetical protein